MHFCVRNTVIICVYDVKIFFGGNTLIYILIIFVKKAKGNFSTFQK